MSEIEVKYLDREGKVGTHTFDTDSRRIEFPRKDYLYVDLSPLARCKSIQKVFISCCSLRCLDITPVIHAPFEYLHHHGYTYTLLSRETVESIQSPNINRIQLFDTPSYYCDESTISFILPLLTKYESDSWKISFLGDCLVLAENIPGIGLVDLSAEDIYEMLQNEDRKQRRKYILSRYCDQIDRGGTTICASINQFMNCIPELTKRIKNIIELRKAEMGHLAFKLNSETNEIDLHSLFLTAYGFQILSSLELGLKCTSDEFKLIQKALDDLGFPIYRPKNPGIKNSTSISKPLREYIWKLAANPLLRTNVATNSLHPSHVLRFPFERGFGNGSFKRFV